MSNNRTILTHIATDPNAPKHLAIGCIVGLVSLLFLQAWWPPIAAAAGAGISIEIWQRMNGGRNSLRESIFDAMTTMLGCIPAVVSGYLL